MINIIVAHSLRRGIGLRNKLPWNLGNDIKCFKKRTIGEGNNCVIMGRNTWDSFPKKAKPLTERYNIVISKTMKKSSKYMLTGSVDEAIDHALKKKFDRIWVIGGAGIYDSALRTGRVDKIYITNIQNDIPCDTFFPDISSDYHINSAGHWLYDGIIKYRFETYAKNNMSMDSF